MTLSEVVWKEIEKMIEQRRETITKLEKSLGDKAYIEVSNDFSFNFYHSANRYNISTKNTGLIFLDLEYFERLSSASSNLDDMPLFAKLLLEEMEKYRCLEKPSVYYSESQPYMKIEGSWQFTKGKKIKNSREKPWMEFHVHPDRLMVKASNVTFNQWKFKDFIDSIDLAFCRTVDPEVPENKEKEESS